MIGHVHDRADVWQLLRTRAVYLKADLHAVVSGVAGDLVERSADLLERLFDRHVGGQGIGPYLHAAAADVLAEKDELLRLLDVFRENGWIGRVVFADAAQPDDLHRTVSKPLADLLPLPSVERRFHAVLVCCPQFHPGEARGRAILNQRGHVPGRAPVVGHQSELERGR